MRRVPSGRAVATSTLSTGGTQLAVSSVAALLGADMIFDSLRQRIISCGSDGKIVVDAMTAAQALASLTTNMLTVSSVDNVGTTCVRGSIVSVKDVP